jgi:ADP-ribose pyrophosphatase YjhB (NUDIX family)
MTTQPIGWNDYPRPSVASDIVLFVKQRQMKFVKLLMVQRKNEPFKDHWALPGGFVEPNESVLDAALRELKEETGLVRRSLEQIFVLSNPNRDPRGWVMGVAHLGLAYEEETSALKAGDDAADAKLFEVHYKRESGKIQLTLQGPDNLQAELEYDDSGNAFIIDNHGIAFDHAIAIEKSINRVLEYSTLAENGIFDHLQILEFANGFQ